jgi:hypothetical protein
MLCYIKEARLQICNNFCKITKLLSHVSNQSILASLELDNFKIISKNKIFIFVLKEASGAIYV